MRTLCAPFRLCITHNWQSTMKRPSKSTQVTEGDYSANIRLSQLGIMELCDYASCIMRDLPNYAEGHQLCAKLCTRIIA